MVGLKTEILMLHLLQAADQQPGSRKQNNGDRGLHDHESLLRQR